MPLRFTAPEFRQRGASPADHLVDSFPSGRIEIILGVTLPKYCGVVIDDPRLDEATLSLPPIVPAGEGWAFSCRTLLYHDFSWTIEIPPNPPWISAQIPGATIKKLATLLDKNKLVNSVDFTHVTRVEVVPMPNWLTVKQHIENHERQHVVDHKWLVDKLFRPVVMMWDSFALYGGRIVARNRDILQHVIKGEGEPVSIHKYLEATHISGLHFHSTAEGAWPDLEFAGLSNDGLKALIHLSQRTAMPPVDFYNSPPHAYFKVDRYGVKNQIEAADLGIRCVLELRQESVDQLEQDAPERDDSEDESSGTVDLFEW